MRLSHLSDLNTQRSQVSLNLYFGKNEADSGLNREKREKMTPLLCEFDDEEPASPVPSLLSDGKKTIPPNRPDERVVFYMLTGDIITHAIHLDAFSNFRVCHTFLPVDDC